MDLKRIGLNVCLFCLLTMSLGYSSKLSRREAKNLIRAMQKREAQELGVLGTVPGFSLSDKMTDGGGTFQLTPHQAYDKLGREGYLVQTLATPGYVTVYEEGPKTVAYHGSNLPFAHSRTVRLTDKVDTATETGNSKELFRIRATCSRIEVDQFANRGT